MFTNMVCRSILGLLVVFVFATSLLFFLYYLSGPDERLHLPRDLDDLVQLRIVLDEYAVTRRFYTLIFFSCVYLYKQSFAIPGSIFLNLMAGAIFGVVKGFPLCCALSAIGASSCFLISSMFGKTLLMKFAPGRVTYFQGMVEKSREDKALFGFLLSLRIFPMTPNWLINVSSPVVGVPLRLFFLSVLLGLAPYNFITINAGSALADLKSLDDVMSWKVAGGLGLLAIGVLNPFKYLRRKPSTSTSS